MSSGESVEHIRWVERDLRKIDERNATVRFRAGNRTVPETGRRISGIQWPLFEGSYGFATIESKAVLPYTLPIEFNGVAIVAITLKVTAKGQITLRKEVLNHLGVRPRRQA